MAIYPTTLPAPRRQLSGSMASSSRRRVTVSGREETRVFGVQVDDPLQVVFRLRNDEVAAWIAFYEQTANMGLNWASAYWLPWMGYSDHMFRVASYPRRTGQAALYSDYSVMIAVRESALCWPDTTWPTIIAVSGNVYYGDNPVCFEGRAVYYEHSGNVYYGVNNVCFEGREVYCGV